MSAAIFVGLEGWDYGTAYYHCLITATTIGYGDVSIQSTAGQWFASFHMMFSVALVAELLGSIKVIADLHKVLLRRTRMLEMKLNGTLLERMQSHAKELRPPVSPNSVRASKDANEGVNELEFAMGMLIELGMVTTDQVLPCAVPCPRRVCGREPRWRGPQHLDAPLARSLSNLQKANIDTGTVASSIKCMTFACKRGMRAPRARP